MPGGELSVRTYPHPSGLWITMPLTVGRVKSLAMVIDSGSPVSAISPEIADELRQFELLAPAEAPRYEYRLTALTVDGQPLPDLEVRILPRLTRLGIAGLVGLDFLSQFLAVHFYVLRRELVLEDS